MQILMRDNAAMIFKNRYHAGQLLAASLKKYNNQPNTLVLGLARGGVVTAHAVAQCLHLPLDVLAPRKIGAPSNPELAIGAISDQGVPLLNEELIRQLTVSKEHLETTIAKEKATAAMRLNKFRQHRPPLSLTGKTLILVDDGLATGATMQAAIKGIKAHNPGSIIVAVPVSPPDTIEKIKGQVDEIVCLMIPRDFMAVGQFYEDFSQTEDSEVVAILQNTKAT